MSWIFLKFIDKICVNNVVLFKDLSRFNLNNQSEIFWLRSAITTMKEDSVIFIFYDNTERLSCLFEDPSSPFYHSDIQIK